MKITINDVYNLDELNAAIEFLTEIRDRELTKAKENVLNWEIRNKCEFSIRTMNCLASENIFTVQDLIEHTEDEIKNIKALGRISFCDIAVFMKQHNIRFKNETNKKTSDRNLEHIKSIR